MKRSTRVLTTCAVAVAAIAAVVAFLELRPIALATVVDRAFGYQMKEDPVVVVREWKKPFGVQGVAYHEETTLRLSESDYRDLLARLMADRSFKKKSSGSGERYERFVVGREFVSWAAGPAPEFRFSYTEY